MPKDCVQLLLSTLIPRRLTSYQWSVCFGLCAILATGLGRLYYSRFAVTAKTTSNDNNSFSLPHTIYHASPHVYAMSISLACWASARVLSVAAHKQELQLLFS